MRSKSSPHIAIGSDFRRDERGTLLVEFTITILTVLVVIFMTVELCSAVYTYVVLSEAANEGVRYAIVHSSDESLTERTVRNYAAYSLHDMSGTKLSVRITYPADPNCTIPGAPPCKVQISVSYPYLPYLNFMNSMPTMRAYAEGRLVN
jgi:Flp pilus assembly protein TadG